MLRSYCSMHMAALYVAYVGGLQGFGSLLQPKEWQALLTAVGAWQPAAAATMLPVLALLLLVRLASLRLTLGLTASRGWVQAVTIFRPRPSWPALIGSLLSFP